MIFTHNPTPVMGMTDYYHNIKIMYGIHNNYVFFFSKMLIIKRAIE